MGLCFKVLVLLFSPISVLFDGYTIWKEHLKIYQLALQLIQNVVLESNLVPAPQVEDQQQNEESLETTSEEHPSAGHTNEDTLEEVCKELFLK